MGSGAVDPLDIEQSLIFEGDGSAGGSGGKLSKSPSSSGNLKTWTYSTWVKIPNPASDGIGQYLYGFSNYPNSYSQSSISINGAGALRVVSDQYTSFNLTTNRLLRDPSAWYHIVAAIDTTQSTAANRLKIYVNGVQETSFSTATYPGLNAESAINRSGHIQNIGYTNSYYVRQQLAETHFINGSQLTPSSFGETNEETGQWIPKKYSGSYSTNGFYLKFVSGAIGTDSSGQGNNYTASNLANADVVTDTPTNNCMTLNPFEKTSSQPLTEGNLFAGSVSGETYAAATYYPTGGKFYYEYKLVQYSASGIGVAYFKHHSGSYIWNDVNGNSYKIYGSEGNTTISNNWTSGNIIQIAVDETAGKLWYGRNNTWYTVDGTPNPATGSGPSHTFTTPSTQRPYIDIRTGGSQVQIEANYGQRDFAYTPPSGFVAPTAKNLPDPAIPLPSAHFNTVLYTGTGATPQTVTGVGFQPDFVWIKNRPTGATNHVMYDAVRGTNKTMASSTTNAESSDDTAGFSAFTSDGFTLRTLTTAQGTQNTLNQAHVSWNWKAGGTAPVKTYVVKVVSDSGNKYRFDDFAASAQTVDLQEGGTYTFDQSDSSNSGHPLRFSTTSNGSHGGGSEYTTGVTTNGTPGSSGAYTKITVAASTATLYYYCTAHSGMGGQANTNSTHGSTYFDGAIKSTVSANQAAGFSIVNWTSNNSNTGTIPHGLGVTPEIIFYKVRNGSGGNWNIWTTAIDGSNDYLILNTTAAKGNIAGTYGNLTSSFITNWGFTGAPSMLAYCFASKDAYSSIGSYSGNGSANGTFVNTGFRPAWVMIKRTDTTGEWVIFDNKRSTFNVVDKVLLAENYSAEYTIANMLDINSNGFKMRDTHSSRNASGGTYLYMAFAESAFKYANAR